MVLLSLLLLALLLSLGGTYTAPGSPVATSRATAPGSVVWREKKPS